MARGRKKKVKKTKEFGKDKGALPDGMYIEAMARYLKRGDNGSALSLAKKALDDPEAAPESKAAALSVRHRLSYDSVAILFAGGGAVIWFVLLMVFVIGRG